MSNTRPDPRDNLTPRIIRHGVKIWHIMEVILTELLDSNAIRKSSPLFPPNLKLMEP